MKNKNGNSGGSYKCKHCKSSFKVNSKSIKNYIAFKKGEIIQDHWNRKSRDCNDGFFSLTTDTYDQYNYYMVKKDIKLEGIKCTICNKINWIDNRYNVDFTNKDNFIFDHHRTERNSHPW